MLPINHLKKTLDRCCGQWEFYREQPSDVFTVRFLNTGEVYQCFHATGEGKWLSNMLVDGQWKVSDFLTSRLNCLTRGDAGRSLPADFDCVPGVE